MLIFPFLNLYSRPYAINFSNMMVLAKTLTPNVRIFSSTLSYYVVEGYVSEILLGYMYTVCNVKTVGYSVFQRSFSHKYIHISSQCPFLLALNDIVVFHVLN